MHNRFSPLVIGLGIFLFLLIGGSTARCQVQATNIVNFTNITASTSAPLTNNSTIVTIGSVYFPNVSAHITDTGLSPTLGTTNSLIVNQEVSFDGVNWFVLNSWQPSSTNPVYYAFNPESSSETVYMRYAYVATNNVGLGINIP